MQGDEAALAAALEAADRRTLVVVAAADGVAFYGLAVDSKAGAVARAVNAQDIAVTIATIADLPVGAQCTGGIIYQAMKNPNLKLDEIRKLKEALVRMESVIQRDANLDKHDCAINSAAVTAPAVWGAWFARLSGTQPGCGSDHTSSSSACGVSFVLSLRRLLFNLHTGKVKI